MAANHRTGRRSRHSGEARLSRATWPWKYGLLSPVHPRNMRTMLLSISAGRHAMSVARVTEISATSTASFEEALKQGIDRANKTLRNVKGAWVKEQQVEVTNGKISQYRVNLLVTFVLDD